MTARANLSVVGAQPADTPNPRAESMLAQWAPESQLVGSLMHLPAAQATPILALVPVYALVTGETFGVALISRSSNGPGTGASSSRIACVSALPSAPPRRPRSSSWTVIRGKQAS